MRAKGGRTDRMLLHFPGGAYLMRLPNMERTLAARICRAANAHARLVFYRLAPEHPYPAAHEDCLGAYRQLLATRHRRPIGSCCPGSPPAAAWCLAC